MALGSRHAFPEDDHHRHGGADRRRHDGAGGGRSPGGSALLLRTPRSTVLLDEPAGTRIAGISTVGDRVAVHLREAAPTAWCCSMHGPARSPGGLCVRAGRRVSRSMSGRRKISPRFRQGGQTLERGRRRPGQQPVRPSTMRRGRRPMSQPRPVSRAPPPVGPRSARCAAAAELAASPCGLPAIAALATAAPRPARPQSPVHAAAPRHARPPAVVPLPRACATDRHRPIADPSTSASGIASARPRTTGSIHRARYSDTDKATAPSSTPISVCRRYSRRVSLGGIAPSPRAARSNRNRVRAGWRSRRSTGSA